MQVVIQNPSGQPRHDWVPVTFPVRESPIHEGVVGMFQTSAGAYYKAVAGPVLGPGVQIAHIGVSIQGWERLSGKVSWSSTLAPPEPIKGWAPSYWPADIKVVLPDAEFTFELPEEGFWRQRNGHVSVSTYTWSPRSGCPYIPTIYIYQASDLDLVRFELTLRHSDPMSAEVRAAVRSIALESPIPFCWRWAKQTGRRQPTLENGIWQGTLLEEDFTGDSQAICVSGAFLFGPGAEDKPKHPSEWADYGLRLQSLAAERESGPCFAICKDWCFSAWGPAPGGALVLPYWVERDGCMKEAKKNWFSFMSTPGTPWVLPRMGLQLSAGSTGDQQAFGASKALDVIILNDPMMIDELEWSATQQLACRPGHYCETDGMPVRSANHLNPRWVSWNEVTHYSGDVSPERFGKVDGVPAQEDCHMWSGRDAEHHAVLVETAAYVLTGSCQLEGLLRDVSERLMSEVTVPSLYGRVSTNCIGASRAVGRTIQSAAWLEWALKDTGLMSRMRARFDECIWPQWNGRSDNIDELLDYARDKVRIIDLITDQRMPLGVGWRPPFEAMGAHGVYLLWLKFKDPRMLALVYSVGKSILAFGTRNGKVLYGVNTPDAINPTAPLSSDQYEQGGPWFDEGEGDWNWWSFPGVVATREAAKAVGDVELRAMADSWLAHVRQESDDMFQAQGAMFHVEHFWRYLEWTQNL